ncbi:MAG: DUF1232 domain-containing protein [Chloroflexota bacterium]
MFEELQERLQAFWLSLRLTYRLFLDTRVPFFTKVVPILTVFYIFSPIDVIPDFLIALGQLDDFLILTMGLQLFERLAPAEVVEEHRYQLLLEQEQKSGEQESF